MSDERQHWFRRVQDILCFIDKIEAILDEKTQDDLLDDDVLYLAVERLLQNIGEAAIHLPDEIKDKAQDIPWRDIAGMRHVLVHGYDIVEPEIIWNTVKMNMGDLKAFLATLSADELS